MQVSNWPFVNSHSHLVTVAFQAFRSSRPHVEFKLKTVADLPQEICSHFWNNGASKSHKSKQKEASHLQPNAINFVSWNDDSSWLVLSPVAG